MEKGGREMGREGRGGERDGKGDPIPDWESEKVATPVLGAPYHHSPVLFESHQWCHCLKCGERILH